MTDNRNPSARAYIDVSDKHGKYHRLSLINIHADISDTMKSIEDFLTRMKDEK